MTIENFGLTDINIFRARGSGPYAGGLAGYSYSSATFYLQNSYSAVDVTAGSYAVGLLGSDSTRTPANHKFSNCYVTGTISGSSARAIVVHYYGDQTMTDCYYNIETTGLSDDGTGRGITIEELDNLIVSKILPSNHSEHAAIVRNQ